MQRTQRLYCLTFDGRGIRPSMSGPPLSSPAISVDFKSVTELISAGNENPAILRVSIVQFAICMLLQSVIITALKRARI